MNDQNMMNHSIIIENQGQGRRPKDWAYLVSFERRSELDAAHQMIRNINETQNVSIIENLHALCEQKLTSGATSSPTIEGFTISNVLKTDDLATNPGLQQAINIIIGTSSTRYRYMGHGYGTASPTIADTALQLQSERIDMSVGDTGWRLAVGMKLFFGGLVDEQSVTNFPRELGVFNSTSGGTMFNRSVFSENLVSRTQSRTGAIITCVVEFCPLG